MTDPATPAPRPTPSAEPAPPTSSAEQPPPAAEHILVVGEALIDVVHRADGSVSEHPGGSLANVALTLGRLGRTTRLATWIGQDDYGDQVIAWLRDSGVEVTDGSRGAAATGVATAHLDATGAATYDFRLSWQVPSDATCTPKTMAMHSGSIAAILEPGATAVRDLMATARPTATITLDPNIRPALITDAPAARERLASLIRLADVIKVSDEDLLWLAPDQDPVTTAAEILDAGPALVVLTRGAQGALAWTRQAMIDIPAAPAPVVDTVGAGDSFMGALLDGLWSAGLLGAGQRPDLQSSDADVIAAIISRCAAVAAVTVSRPGADPPRRDEVPELPRHGACT